MIEKTPLTKSLLQDLYVEKCISPTNIAKITNQSIYFVKKEISRNNMTKAPSNQHKMITYSMPHDLASKLNLPATGTIPFYSF